MSEKQEPLNKHSDFLGFDGIGPDPTKFKTYNEFVAESVKDLPEHLIILLPYDGGEMALQILQLTWLNDFWKGQKNLFT